MARKQAVQPLVNGKGGGVARLPQYPVQLDVVVAEGEGQGVQRGGETVRWRALAPSERRAWR